VAEREDPGEPAAPDLDAVTLTATPVVELDQPIAVAVRPDDDALYIAERSGRVVRVVDGTAEAAPVLDITGQTTQDAERGLLGLAFSPDGGTLYVSYTDLAGDTQLDAYEVDATTARPDTRRNLLSVDQPFSNHNGGHVVTGPDGLLYLGLGDGGSANDPRGNGQDRSTLLGGVLRIDPSPSADAPYSVPPDNPFVGGSGRGELWVYGLRNPWRFSFDAATDDLWIGDVGQGAVEEIDRLPFDRAGGTNLGWNAFEGTRAFSDAAAPDAVPPVFEYPHDGRCSVTGGYVYRGDDVPGLHGAYVYGDFCDGVVRAIVVDDGTVVQQRAFDVQVPSLVSFAQDADLELYALSLDGTVLRLTGG
jgi:glucose/arabinose dehydrogenase